MTPLQKHHVADLGQSLFLINLPCMFFVVVSFVFFFQKLMWLYCSTHIIQIYRHMNVYNLHWYTKEKYCTPKVCRLLPPNYYLVYSNRSHFQMFPSCKWLEILRPNLHAHLLIRNDQCPHLQTVYKEQGCKRLVLRLWWDILTFLQRAS